ncbi:hypothetical protein COU87_03890 [Candidatus Roizmanbacteria bacterium CG10_big_fil_rev_8_21_14_0_10_39_12]|uniref:Methyltransferase domain-containing protein n=1 Tax=Candidatus Roizmanbacteria bacterium CG10_big_fil_rev_8_21_14_0_10_39_12 TaxID=1974852 RepID=A0A2M8KNS8_9BACT|nr:MAG: hypothetical protein COU87_03890 [Candidatus Roizmanbacteria bacterium CG10_big_fil_rev_8_21_14_0_10_39_12]
MTLNEFMYLFFILAELVFLIGASLYLISLSYSWLSGAPYVATKRKSLAKIIEHAHIQDGQNIIELGSGDGRFLQAVAKKYSITGLGVDVNPLPIFKARFLARIQKISTIKFKIQNIKDTNLSNADLIYAYLLPKFIKTIESQLLKQTKKGVMIASHAFKIDYLEKYLVDTVKGETFKTYFYKMS